MQYVYVNGSTDTSDYGSGHGTHTSGSIAGYPLPTSPLSPYRGMVFGARIAFFDAMKGPGPTMVIPDLYSVVFPAAFATGARIHSDSWYVFATVTLHTCLYIITPTTVSTGAVSARTGVPTPSLWQWIHTCTTTLNFWRCLQPGT